jgi:hypothetical protein
VSLSDSLDRNANIELIRDRVNDFLQELGIKTIRDFSPQFFEIVGTTEGDENGYEIVEPAIVEELEGGGFLSIRLGKVREIRGPIPEVTLHDPELVSDESSNEIATQSVAPSPVVSQVLLVIGSVVIGLLFGFLLFRGDSGNTDKPTESTVTLNSESSTSSTLLSVSTTLPNTTTTGK